MKRIEYFVPGEPGEDKGVLPRLRWPIPRGVTRTYVEAYTSPSEMVVVPYCQGPAAVREALAAERQVLALNFDPTLILAVQASLVPLPARELDAAVARLGDNPKQGMPLRRYLAELYASTCPACFRQVVADFFIWDRERNAPIAKHLRCPACDWDGQTLIDAEDLERLNEIPERAMHYHYVLDRVAPRPQGDALRTRLEQILSLYSARNLYALAELTLRIESLFPPGPLNHTLKILLLDCLDRCSSLTPVPGSTARQRGLSRPSRFLERNVWHTFEEAVMRFQETAEKPVSGLAETVETFQAAGEERASFVGTGLVRDLPKFLAPRSVRLILISPPPLDSAIWSLTYFWGAWLLGAEAAIPLRPLLRQRTPDPAWYARVMAGSLRTLSGLLRDDGRIVLILTGQRPSVVEALLLAASSARLALSSLVQRNSDYRVELTPTFPQQVFGETSSTIRPLSLAVSTSTISLTKRIQKITTETAISTIQARGEPVAWRALHAAIQRRLAKESLLVQALEAKTEAPSPLDLVEEQIEAGLEHPALERIPGVERGVELWWLAEPKDIAPPLCDRVEEAARLILQDALVLKEADFAKAVYARFPGSLTPNEGLVMACLRSYGHELTPGHWRLRPEDLPETRQSERQTMVERLLSLGQRLGYATATGDPFDVAWFEKDRVRAVFAVRWWATLDEVLKLSVPAREVNRYVVIPGGRAELVNFKLEHNPLWQQKVDKESWRFIKYRHVRQLLAQADVDEYALRTIIGLDPIVEREQVQLALF